MNADERGFSPISIFGSAQARKTATNFTNCHEFFLYQFVFIRVIRGKNLCLPEARLSSYVFLSAFICAKRLRNPRSKNQSELSQPLRG